MTDTGTHSVPGDGRVSLKSEVNGQPPASAIDKKSPPIDDTGDMSG